LLNWDLEKTRYKNSTFQKYFGTTLVSAIFRGPKNLNKIAKFCIPKTREKLAKLEIAETTNDMQGLTLFTDKIKRMQN
jgi:hypothetical protein